MPLVLPWLLCRLLPSELLLLLVVVPVPVPVAVAVVVVGPERCLRGELRLGEGRGATDCCCCC